MNIFVFYLCLVAITVCLCACGGGGGDVGGGGVLASGVVVASPPAASPGPASAPARDCTVDFRGDSILHGENTHGVLPETLAQHLERISPLYTVNDLAINGSAINDTVPLLPPAVFHSRFQVLEWGVNDPAHGYTDIKAAYRTVVANVRQAGKVPVITGIDSSFTNSSIATQAKEVALELKVAYAGWDDIKGTTIDGLHPDQVTANVLTQKIVDTLNDLAPECAK
jgi:hypothetical protein